MYTDAKAGGTKKLTLLRKTDGNLNALEQHLAKELSVPLKNQEIQVNRLNGQIVVKVGRLYPIAKAVRRLSLSLSSGLAANYPVLELPIPSGFSRTLALYIISPVIR